MLDKSIAGKDTVNNILLSTVVINVMNNKDVLCPVKALLDSRSQTSIITENMRKRLNLQVKKILFSVAD